MTSLAAELLAIQEVFATEWASAQPTVPVVYAAVAGTSPPEAPYARLSVMSGGSEQVSFGAGDKGMHRSIGVVQVDIYHQLGLGELGVRQLADSAATILRSRSLSSGVTTRSPRVDRIVSEGSHVRLTMSVPFQRDAVYT